MSVRPKWIPSIFQKIVPFLFYGSIFWIIAISELPPVSKPVFLLKEQFLASNEPLFKLQDPGLPYAIFEVYNPPQGRASFLMDAPYDPEHISIEHLQRAQGRLAPLLLNPYPSEKSAFIYCSHNDIAAAQMQSAGYRPLKNLGNGKMIAEKIP